MKPETYNQPTVVRFRQSHGLLGLLLLLILLSASTPAQERPAHSPKLHGGPYVTDVTTTSAVVNWVLRVGPVAVGEAPDRLAPSQHGWRVERVKLTGLKPATTYYYDVLRDSSAEGKGQFTTAPAGPGEFTFVVYGDTRTRHDMHRKVAAKIAEHAATFAVHTGDLVANGTDLAQWPVFFDISKELFRKTAFFPTLGNHDQNSPFFYDFFPRRKGYVSFRWGTVHFTLINSDAGTYAVSPEERERFWAEQLAWLDRDLASAASMDFRFVAFHHTPYTGIKRRQPEAERLAARLTPLFRKHRVQAVFSGHDHNYQRHAVDGIQYIVTGGGGAPLYEIDAPLAGITQKFEKVENFVLARVRAKETAGAVSPRKETAGAVSTSKETAGECHIQALAIDGRVLDSLVLTAAPLSAPARTAQ